MRKAVSSSGVSNVRAMPVCGCGSGEIQEPKNPDKPPEARKAAGDQVFRLLNLVIGETESRGTSMQAPTQFLTGR